MPASRLSPWTHLSSQHKSLKRSVVKPIDWNSFTRDQEMPDAPTNKLSVVVSLKLPAKYWSNGRIIGTSVFKSRNHHEAAACSEGSSNGAQADRDVEILDGLIGSQRLKQGRIHLLVPIPTCSWLYQMTMARTETRSGEPRRLASGRQISSITGDCPSVWTVLKAWVQLRKKVNMGS